MIEPVPQKPQRPPKQTPLFRPEAVEHSRAQWLGEFRLSTPISARVLSTFLLIAVCILITLLFTLQYTRRVEVTGELRSDPGIARVSTGQSGVIQSLYVAEGQTVHAGQPLFSLVKPRTLPSMQDAAFQELTSIKAQTTALLSEQMADTSGLASQVTELTRKRENIQGQIASLQSQRKRQALRVSLSRAILQKYTALHARGYTSDIAVMLRRDDFDAKQQNLDGLDGSILQARAALLDVEGQIAAVRTSFSERAGATEQQLDDLSRQAVQIEAGASDIVRAPISGTITGVNVSVGQHVDDTTRVLAIVPGNGQLDAVLKASGEAAGLAKTGETVLLRVSEYPYERFGLLAVHIRSITRTSVEDDAAQAGSVGSRAFLIYARLPSTTIRSDGATYALRPGMTVTGDLLLDRKPLAMWLFAPIQRFFSASRK